MRTFASANPQVRRRFAATEGLAFVGPLDALPAPLAAYSFRRLTSAYTDNKAVRLRRASDNAEMDFGFNSNGSFDASGAAVFIGASSGSLVTFYDQSGNGFDLSQGAAANQPGYTTSALVSNQPAASFLAASAQRLVDATVTSTAPPFTLMAVSARTGNTAAFNLIFGTVAANPVLDYANAANTVRLTAGVTQTIAGVGDNVAHCLGASVNGVSSRWCVDGAASAFAGSPGANSIISLGIGAYTAGGNPLTGIIVEALAFASALSDANMQTIQAGQKALYGTP